MKRIAVLLVAVATVASVVASMAHAAASKASTPAHEHRIPAGSTELYSRDIGQGTAIIVLHGGPGFYHRYLLPDMDRLSDSYRLIYYDQRAEASLPMEFNPKTLLSTLTSPT